ncbi:lebercilin isoform X6 [Silurus meridionalis]|nr:lebercilin isoform X6 [Silurus meridionalis]
MCSGLAKKRRNRVSRLIPSVDHPRTVLAEIHSEETAWTLMDPYDFEDNRMTESEHAVQVSRQSDHRDSALAGKRNGNKTSTGNRTRTRERTRDPDKDRISDGEQSTASFYSDDYENTSPSEKSFSPSRSPSTHRGARTHRVSSSLRHTTGVRKGAPRHPGPQAPPPQQRSSGMRSQSLGKDAPPKNLDLVTKRLLSARLLKISELKNGLAELQLHTDELQRENRLLKQLQLRHEKALHRYNDTESEISQLISRHNNETHVLRERLRRTQEKERAAERRCTEAEAQLQRCRDQLHKLQKLADDQRLGERDELARKLTFLQVKVQDSERRVKELERNMELSTGSFQRQLANERKKTHDALQETQMLRGELDKLSAKLKERERELDTRNIYANRIRGVLKKDLEDSTRIKGASRSNSKAVQTEDRKLSPDFPSPPLAISNDIEFPYDGQTEDHLSLKERQSSEQKQTQAEEQRIREMVREQKEERAQGMEREEQEREKDRLRKRERESEKEKEKVPKQRFSLEFDLNEGKAMRQSNGWDRDEEDSRRRNEEEKGRYKEPLLTEQEIQDNRERAEVERRRKDQLLSKMREIDSQAQAQDSGFFHDQRERTRTPPRTQNASIFSFTEPHEYLSTLKPEKRGGALRSQKTNQDLDLTFGSYAPSFGKPAPRAGRRTPSLTADPSSGDEHGGNDVSGLAKAKKSNLMQQLFGSATRDSHSKMEILSTSTKSSTDGCRDPETPNTPKRTALHVSESGPAVRAITTLDDDIEELVL